MIVHEMIASKIGYLVVVVLFDIHVYLSCSIEFDM